MGSGSGVECSLQLIDENDTFNGSGGECSLQLIDENDTFQLIDENDTFNGSGAECSLQLIDENGTFNGTRLDNFIKQVQLAQCGVSYAVVSIMGPQSSGKSTLLNHLFGTNFREMNAFDGRSQTTKGIWLANCVGIEPRTIVMDVEGTDGRERGQDDTAFEKQSALFALAVSDIVLLNMWCHEIGREQAANKPLLRTVFQVMMTLFSPRKVTLMFVIRDKSKTPLEILEMDLKKDIQMIWDSVPKPQAHKQTPLSEIFNVKVVAFSNYERDEELFKKEMNEGLKEALQTLKKMISFPHWLVASLRQQFFHSITPGRLAEDRRGVVPASEFSLSAQHIWEIIKENKDLNLPKHRVMVATVRCKEISREKFAWFSQNKDWCKIEKDVQHGIVSGFGEKVNSLINTCLSEYDIEATFYDEGVRSEKRKKLEKKLLLLLDQSAAYTSMMKHIKSTTLREFKKAFTQALHDERELEEAVSYCTSSSMTQFDKRCADADIKLADLGTLKKKTGDDLQYEIDGMARRTSNILEKAKWKMTITKGIINAVTMIGSLATVAMIGSLTTGGATIGPLTTGGATIGPLAAGDLTGVLASIGGTGVGAAIAALIGSKMKKSAIKEAINEIGQGSGW